MTNPPYKINRRPYKFNRLDLWGFIHHECDKWSSRNEISALFQIAHLRVHTALDTDLLLAWVQAHHDYHRNMVMYLCEMPDWKDDKEAWARRFNAHEKERWCAYRLMEAIREWVRQRDEEEIDPQYPEHGIFAVTDDPYYEY